MDKVLFVATVTSHINAFHIPYLKWFKEQGYEVHVASKGNQEIEYCDKHFDIPFERFPIKKNNLKAYNELKKIINENNYKIIHCHTPVGGVLARLAARKARKKGTRVIYTAHGFHFYKGAPLLNWIIYYPLEKWMAHYTDVLITINNEDYKIAKKHFKRVKKIKFTHGVGINTKRFDIALDKEEKKSLRKKIGLNKDDIVLSYVAELNNNKNQNLLIETMEELKSVDNRYKLLLIGEGPNKQKYIDKIKELDLEDNIKVLGKRVDVPQLLSITDIYVASSIREGLGLNVIEAMYMNLPIIAMDNRGHRELINDEFRIKNDKIELKEKILNLNNNAYNYKTNVELYTINNVLKEMTDIYKDELKI